MVNARWNFSLQRFFSKTPSINSTIPSVKAIFTKPRCLLIDTDCGIDDAIAISLALSNKQWNVKAIFAVKGNADVDQVVENVRYTSTLVPPSDDTKLYRGSSESILKYKQPEPWSGGGPRGFGNVHFAQRDLKTALKCEKEHAVSAMVNIVKKKPGTFDMIALGPLSNIALAIKFYPKFIDNLKSLWIMGGQEALGNTTPLTESNFRSDPEAAKIVLDAAHAEKIRVVTWDCTLHNALLWSEYDKLTQFPENKMAMFLHNLNSAYSEQRSGGDWYIPDGVAMWCMMNEEECQIVDRKMMVEIGGDMARGALAIDHYGYLIDNGRTPSKLVRQPPSTRSFKQGLNKLIGDRVFSNS